MAGTLREKLRKYPGLNTPLGIPGVFPGVSPLLVYFWPFWGYFVPKYPKPLRLGVFRMVYSQSNSTYTRHFPPKMMPPVHSLDLVLVANAPGRTYYWE
jgi:hypothetical protein